MRPVATSCRISSVPGVAGFIARPRSFQDRRYLDRRRGISASLASNDSVDQYHSNARNVPKLHAVEQVTAGGMLSTIKKYQVRSPSDLDDTRVQRAHPCRISGRVTEYFFRRDVGHARQKRNHAKHPQGLDTRARGTIGTENDAIGAFELSRMPR